MSNGSERLNTVVSHAWKHRSGRAILTVTEMTRRWQSTTDLRCYQFSTVFKSADKLLTCFLLSFSFIVFSLQRLIIGLIKKCTVGFRFWQCFLSLRLTFIISKTGDIDHSSHTRCSSQHPSRIALYWPSLGNNILIMKPLS